MAGREAAGTLSSRFDLRVLQTGALGVRGIAMPLVAIVRAFLATDLTGTVITSLLFLVIGMTWAVIAVTAGTIITRISPAGVRGEALEDYAALTTLAGGIGSIGGGALATAYGFTVSFSVTGVVILSGALLVLTLREISTRTQSNVAAIDESVDETPPVEQ